MTARLCAEEISVAYGSVRAVDSWSISVAAGSCVGIVGANGAGKSSFMRALAGLQRPSGGSWAFDGQRVPAGRPWQIAARGAAFVPEGRELFRRLTVEENIRLGSARLARHEREAAVRSALAYFPALPPLLGRRAGLLSGGEQQMVALARALAGRPSILLVDEPALGLAPSIVLALARTFAEIRSSGTAILVAEQHVGLVRNICSQVYLVRLGQLITSGNTDLVLDEDSLRRTFL